MAREAAPALHRSREALLDYLAVAIDERERAQTTIVFDAAGAPPGLPRTITREGITVHFARGYPDADEMIEDLIEAEREPKALLVVSSDHRVQRAARRRKAKLVDSERWFADLQAARRSAEASTLPPAKPVGSPSPDDVAYWLDKFSQPLPEEKTETRRPRIEPIGSAPVVGPSSSSDDDRGSDAPDKPTDAESARRFGQPISARLRRRSVGQGMTEWPQEGARVASEATGDP